MNILVLMYVLGVVVLHVIPTGGAGLNSIEFGPLRADYLLHSLVFLPWMFLLLFKPVASCQCSAEKPRAEPGRLPGWFTIRNTGSGLLNRYQLQASDIRPVVFLAWMGLGIVLAAGSEGIQYWLPHRTFNPWDAVFNVLGVLLGAVLILGIVLLRKAQNQKSQGLREKV